LSIRSNKPGKSNEKLFHYSGLFHGGNTIFMSEKYGIAVDKWLDLSTGLNPNSWPVPEIPDSVWQSLPQDDDELQNAACNYYGCEYCLPVSGSQAAIQVLPVLRNLSNVGVLSPTYAEHEQAWRKAGHNVHLLQRHEIESELDKLDVLIVVNPNNPTGEIIPGELLLKWQQILSRKGGWLIVDEAFMDITPELSLLDTGIRPGLIVLRSLGKFFGLAGIRVGFIITHRDLLSLVAEKTGPWSVTSVSRYIAIRALNQTQWQIDTRKSLKTSSKRMTDLLNQYGFEIHGSGVLFLWIKHPAAKQIFELFAQQGILLRLFAADEITSNSLRFGLPKDEVQWSYFEKVLTSIPNNLKADLPDKKDITTDDIP